MPACSIPPPCTGAFLVELAARRAADTNPADDIAAGHDRHPTDRVGDVGQWRFAG
jgi:hypothetical protein